MRSDGKRARMRKPTADASVLLRHDPIPRTELRRDKGLTPGAPCLPTATVKPSLDRQGLVHSTLPIRGVRWAGSKSAR